jgi:uncharacterized protein (DUF58 family)
MSASVPGARLIDPLALARIKDLGLVARVVVQGFVNGLHRSPYLGASVDFAEHRAYMPGDDIRRIDWRLFARSDRFYVKEFEADSNSNFVLLLDCSRSMAYASAGLSKLEYAKRLAACLAYFARGQKDRVGLVLFDREIVGVVPPSAKHLDAVLHALDRVAERPGPGELLAPLLRAAEASRRRGLLVLISDLYEEPDVALRAVRALQHKGSDLIVFHVLDPAELDFPFEGAANFEDLESAERMPIVPEHVREGYRREMQRHVAALQRAFGENRIDYELLDTRTPLDRGLVRYLSRRDRLTR